MSYARCVCVVREDGGMRCLVAIGNCEGGGVRKRTGGGSGRVKCNGYCRDFRDDFVKALGIMIQRLHGYGLIDEDVGRDSALKYKGSENIINLQTMFWFNICVSRPLLRVVSTVVICRFQICSPSCDSPIDPFPNS